MATKLNKKGACRAKCDKPCLNFTNHPSSRWFAKRLFPVGIKRFAPLFAEGIDSTEKHGKLNKKISEAKGDKI